MFESSHRFEQGAKFYDYENRFSTMRFDKATAQPRCYYACSSFRRRPQWARNRNTFMANNNEVVDKFSSHRVRPKKTVSLVNNNNLYEKLKKIINEHTDIAVAPHNLLVGYLIHAGGCLERRPAAKRSKKAFRTMRPIRFIPRTQDSNVYLLGANFTRQAVHGYELCKPTAVSIPSSSEAIKGTLQKGTAKLVCPEAMKAVVFEAHEIELVTAGDLNDPRTARRQARKSADVTSRRAAGTQECNACKIIQSRSNARNTTFK